MSKSIKIVKRKDIDILEERGLWKASSFIHGIVKRLIRKKLPLEIRYFKEAHRIIFTTAGQKDMAGKYRRHNGPELKRIDGTLLKMADWRQISNLMAQLDFELKKDTEKIHKPENEKEYQNIIFIAAKYSHWFASIHPFENGNGRISRLILNAVLLRAGLPEIAIKKTKLMYLRAMCQADHGDFSLLRKIIIDGLLEAKKN
ncbi:MAG: Fic family protein [Candidatus Parcubacteria bacterium]|nr:Fic family protein [Candidatus Parcubacteria bacterium]